jgi:hypothetical protein
MRCAAPGTKSQDLGRLCAALQLTGRDKCMQPDAAEDMMSLLPLSTEDLQRWLRRHGPQLLQLHCDGTHAWSQAGL